jgi:hypothetical protein
MSVEWRWMRLRRGVMSKRSHRMRPEGGWWVSMCGFAPTTKEELLVEDETLKCLSCLRRERRAEAFKGEG